MTDSLDMADVEPIGHAQVILLLEGLPDSVNRYNTNDSIE